jgi:hypothetical protein
VHRCSPRRMADEILQLLGDGPVAVRSSAVAEDLADASFAGQYETVLNVRGPDALREAIRHVRASTVCSRWRSGMRPSATSRHAGLRSGWHSCAGPCQLRLGNWRLVGNHTARFKADTVNNLPKEAFGRPLLTPRLDQYVQHDAMSRFNRSRTTGSAALRMTPASCKSCEAGSTCTPTTCLVATTRLTPEARPAVS